MAQTSLFSNLVSSEQLGKKENCVDYIYELAPYGTPLLAKVGMNSLDTPCFNSSGYMYPEVIARPKRTTLNGAIASTDTTIVFTDNIFSASERVQIGGELVTLGSTADGGYTFTSCVRSVGTFAACVTGTAPCATGAQVLGVGVPKGQGHAASSTSDQHWEANIVTAYPKLFSKTVTVSNSANATAQYGIISNPADVQGEYQVKELNEEFENSLLFEVAQAPSGTGTGGSFSGVIERTIAASNYASASDLDITLAALEAGIDKAVDYGSPMDMLFAPPRAGRVLDSMGLAHVSVDPALSAQYGYNVKSLMLGGLTLAVKVVPKLKAAAMVVMVNSSLIKFGPQQGMEMTIRKLADTGSRVQLFVEGSYVGAVPAPQGHYLVTNVKV